MKRVKTIALLITITIFVQLIPIYAVTDTSQTNYINATTDCSASDPDIVIEQNIGNTEITQPTVTTVSDEELYQAYETFMLYVDNNDLPVVFDFVSFKDEFITLGYTEIEEYLNALYGLFDPTDKENNTEQQKNDSFDDVSIDRKKPENYRDGLDYSDEILQAYEDISVFLESENITMDLCLEDFAEQCVYLNNNDIVKYCNKLKEELTKTHSLVCSSEQSTSNKTSSDSSNNDDKYYYNIEMPLQHSPDYTRYNILQLAQKGDILLDDNGSFGIFGHAAIVEGRFYDSTYGYYIRVIEAVGAGVCRGIFDARRADDRDTYLYKVFTATPEQKKEAVGFCITQLGKPWFLNLTHDYSEDTSPWMCSQLVWAGYKNQGVDIEIDGGSGGEVGVTPHDITENSSMVTHVDFREDLNTVPNGTYYLTNYKSNLRLDIRGGIPMKSVPIQQYYAGVYPEQKWKFTYHEDGRYYTIESNITDNGSFYLDIDSPDSGKHAKVTLWNVLMKPEEKWFIQKDSGNTYRFINSYNGLCMDISGGSTAEKADVQVCPYYGSDDQKWMLSRCGEKIFSDGTYYIENVKSGLRLDIRGGTPAKSVQIQQSMPDNYTRQQWVLEWCPTWSCYYIKSNITNNGTFYLDVASPSSGAHAKVKLWDVCTNPEERWTILSSSGGSFRFINGYDGLCMDIQGGSTENQADVQVYPFVNTGDQKWYLKKIS